MTILETLIQKHFRPSSITMESFLQEAALIPTISNLISLTPKACITEEIKPLARQLFECRLTFIEKTKPIMEKIAHLEKPELEEDQLKTILNQRMADLWGKLRESISTNIIDNLTPYYGKITKIDGEIRPDILQVSDDIYPIVAKRSMLRDSNVYYKIVFSNGTLGLLTATGEWGNKCYSFRIENNLSDKLYNNDEGKPILIQRYPFIPEDLKQSIKIWNKAIKRALNQQQPYNLLYKKALDQLILPRLSDQLIDIIKFYMGQDDFEFSVEDLHQLRTV